MIHYRCPGCGKGMAVDDSDAGKQFKCPVCGVVSHVPQTTASCSHLSEYSPPNGYSWSDKTMICPNPNCGYRGRAISKPKGERAVAYILMALFIVPGLIYAMFFSGDRYFCPKCRSEVNLA